jgi:hypothetical protein
MFMCVVNLKSVNKLDLTWKQSFLIISRVCFGTSKLVQSDSFSRKGKTFASQGSRYAPELAKGDLA